MITGLTQEQRMQVAEEIIMQAYAYAEASNLEIDSEEYKMFFQFCFDLAQLFDGKDCRERLDEQQTFIRRNSLKVLQGGKNAKKGK